MSDTRRVFTYDPACLDCRRDAGKDASGTTWQCAPHVALERDRLREQLMDSHATVDILVSRVHERDAEIAKLKRTGKTEVRFTNNYIKRLHEAEAALAAEREAHAQTREELRYEVDKRFEVDRALAAERLQFALYLKDGETPIERLERERHDNDLLMRLLAQEKAHVEMVVRVEGQRLAARDKEIADLKTERSLADKATDAARSDRDRFQRERDEARALLRQLHPANCDGLHHERRDYHGADEPCPIIARLDAALGGGE